MTRIILDFGSGNTCRNDIKIVKRMIDELVKVDSKKHEVIIKWQLFEKAGENIPLNWGVFKYAYDYAKEKGYQTTASVFDIKSLKYLLEFEIPFVKIANRRDLYYLIDYIPRSIQAIISSDNRAYLSKYNGITILWCISEYPATIEQYKENMRAYEVNISDHTIGINLFKMNYSWSIFEMHYKLKNSTGLDSGPFAKTPEQLKEIL